MVNILVPSNRIGVGELEINQKTTPFVAGSCLVNREPLMVFISIVHFIALA